MSNSEISGNYTITDTFNAVHYGPGCLASALPLLLDALGAKRALIVTGRSLSTKTDVVRKIEAVLAQYQTGAHAGTFTEIGEHAPVSGIEAGLRAIDETSSPGEKVDVLVSVGGGSPIDAAKAIVFKHRERVRASDPSAKALPTIAIPTTLSAAEYTSNAGTTNEEGHKVGVADPELAPAGIILDAELTIDTPERLWLSSGMRALDHAVEGFYRVGAPHPTKILGLAAVGDLFEFLPKCKADPQNLEYRQRLQIASWMSLWPLKVQTAFGLSHALGHKLGATYHISHGITSCLTLSAVVALQVKLATHSEKAWLASAQTRTGATSTGSVDGDILKFSQEIDRLVRMLGLKTDLAACGVPRGDVPDIAARALGEFGPDDPRFDAVVQLLEGLYPPS